MRSGIALVLCVMLVYCSRRVAKKPPNPKRSTRTRRIVHLLVLFVASVIVVDALIGDRGLVAILRARHEYDELSASIARQRAVCTKTRRPSRRSRAASSV